MKTAASPAPAANDADAVTVCAPSARPAEFNGKRIPGGATHYRLRRANGDECTFGQVAGIAVEEWPIEELADPGILRERFGAGDYTVIWVFRDAPEGEPRTSPPHRGAKFRILPSDAVAPAAAPAASAPFTCCGAAWPSAAKFCAMCGKPAPGVEASLARYAPLAPGVGGAPSFLEGMQLAMSLHREVGALAQADAARRVADEQREYDLRLARLNHQFDLDLRAQQARFERILAEPAGAAPSVDPAIAQALASIAQAVQNQAKALAEMQAQIEDAAADADEAVATAEETKGGIAAVLAVLKPLEPMIQPFAQAAIAKWMTPASPAATNGAATPKH